MRKVQKIRCDKIPVIIGVYKITSPTGRVYIGQSNHVNRRLNSYKRMYVKNRGCTILYRSFVKHGVDNHKFEILKECVEPELNKWERYYQEKFDVINGGLNCNLTKSGDKSGKLSKETIIKMSASQKGKQHWLGRKHSEETKAKISKAHTGRKHSAEVNSRKGKKGSIPPMKGVFSDKNPLSKKVDQFNRDGVFIKTWHSATDVCKELGYSNGSISSCCNGNLKQYKGYRWAFYNNRQLITIAA